MTTAVLASADQVVDACGLNCPLPVLKTRKALKSLPSGAILKVVSTDPGSVKDMASFCKATGHELTSQSEEQGIFSFFIRKA